MRVALLGPLAVEVGDAVIDVRGVRQQALVALLALDAGRVVSSDRIVDELWGEDAPANPTNALQATVSRLRRLMGADALVAGGNGYRLDVAPDGVDVHRFEALAAEGRAAFGGGDPAGAAGLLREALALWRGTPLPELGDFAFARTAASRLTEMRAATLDALADAQLALGHHGPLVAELRAAVEQDPLREATWARLMTALYRSGRSADALRAYQEARAALGEQLGIEPGPELRQLEAAILTHAPELATPLPSPARPVARPEPASVRAPRTTFVGRQGELEGLGAAVARAPVVTLVGPGGVGKTRLALELAARWTARGGPAHMVDLAAVVDDDDVPEVLAGAVGARDVGALTGGMTDAATRAAQHLAGQAALVVVDNCEHVIGAAAAAVEAVVDAAPDVRVVATSREALGVPGEQLWPVDPLPVEDAVALFVDRARSVQPAYEPSPPELAVVEDVCRRLDGLPLAVELAAARARALPAAEIAARLDDRFRLLTTGGRTALPRQQTLRAVVEWSHDLLTAEERHVFARLSAFTGGFTLDDAEAVVGGDKVPEHEVGAVVLRLVDKSLVAAGGEPGARAARFSMLQTLWEFAREQLIAGGEETEVRDSHAARFAALAADAAPHLRGPGQRRWLDRLDSDHDNMRAALEWALQREDASLAWGLAADLGWFWYLRGHTLEGARWLAAATAVPGEVEPATRVRALAFSALLGAFAGSPPDDVLAEAEALAESNGLTRDLGECLVVGVAIRRGADHATALAALDRAQALAEGDRWLLGTAEFLRAGVLAMARGPADSRSAAERAVAHFRAQGDDWGVAMTLMTAALAGEAVGDYAGALAAYDEAGAAAERLGSEELVLHFRTHRANLVMLGGRAGEARQLHEATVAEARATAAPDVLAFALNGLGIAARRDGDLATAVAAHGEAHDLYAAGGWTGGAALALSGLGFAAEQSGLLEDADRRHREALRLAREIGDARAIALACEGLAGVAAARGDHQRAAAFLGHARGLRGSVDAPLPAGERFDVDRIEATIRAAIGADPLESDMARGEQAGLDELLGDLPPR